MEQEASPKERQDIFGRPRHLTRSEIASLRQDAISTSMAMKDLMRARKDRQKGSIGRLHRTEKHPDAAE
jgi:hypothetical protein